MVSILLSNSLEKQHVACLPTKYAPYTFTQAPDTTATKMREYTWKHAMSKSHFWISSEN